MSSNSKMVIENGGTVCKSYSSIIFYMPENVKKKIFIGKHFDYSNTTKKHVIKWTGLSQDTLKHLIEIGYFTKKAYSLGDSW